MSLIFEKAILGFKKCYQQSNSSNFTFSPDWMPFVNLFRLLLAVITKSTEGLGLPRPSPRLIPYSERNGIRALLAAA